MGGRARERGKNRERKRREEGRMGKARKGRGEEGRGLPVFPQFQISHYTCSCYLLTCFACYTLSFLHFRAFIVYVQLPYYELLVYAKLSFQSHSL